MLTTTENRTAKPRRPTPARPASRPSGFSAMEKTVLAALAMLPLSGILLLTNGLDGLATRWL